MPPRTVAEWKEYAEQADTLLREGLELNIQLEAEVNRLAGENKKLKERFVAR